MIDVILEFETDAKSIFSWSSHSTGFCCKRDENVLQANCQELLGLIDVELSQVPKLS